MTVGRRQAKAGKESGGGTSEQEVNYRFSKRRRRDRRELLERIVRNLSPPLPTPLPDTETSE